MRTWSLLALAALLAISCSEAQNAAADNRSTDSASPTRAQADKSGTPGNGAAPASQPHAQPVETEDETSAVRQLASSYLDAHAQEIGSLYADYPVTVESSEVSDVVKTGDSTWPYQVQGSLTLATAPGTRDSKQNDVGGARWRVFPVLHVNPANRNVEVKTSRS